MIDPEHERALACLERALQAVGRRERRRALCEARDHLLCATADWEDRGCDPREAARRAIDAFGDVGTIAAGYARPPRPRSRLISGSLVAAATVAVALAIAPSPGGQIGQLVLPTSHAAVTQPPVRVPPRVAPCVPARDRPGRSLRERSILCNTQYSTAHAPDSR